MADVDFLNKIGDNVDRQVTVDIFSRGAINILYSAAREKIGKPLTLAAAQKLKDSLSSGDIVFIATGWPHRPWVSPEIGELDGPPGAATLARSIQRAFDVVPILLCEKALIPSIQASLVGAGLRVVSTDQAIKNIRSRPAGGGAIWTSSVIDFPVNDAEARRMAESLISKFEPSAFISIEKGGMNEKGKIHTSRGVDTGDYVAKVDHLLAQCTKQGIATIGIGDGGNEVGFGLIREAIRKHIPYGEKCQCPCGAGIAPINEAEVIVASSVSNWGAYGIEACLAAMLEKPDVMHNTTLEERVLRESADAGLMDGLGGYAEPGADGLESIVHVSVVRILDQIVRKGLARRAGSKS